MIGIAAMAQIANRTGHAADAANFTAVANRYITEWQQLGIVRAADGTPLHTSLAYGMNDTHGLLYNLYADRLLGLNLVPQYVYDMQSEFYPTVRDAYGVPLDTRHTYTKSTSCQPRPWLDERTFADTPPGDWEMFCAAVASNSTRDLFISDIANFINVTPTNHPLTDLYDAVSGE